MRRITTFLAISLLWIGAAFAQVEVEKQWLQGYQFFDNNGQPLEGAFITIQEAGTTTNRVTYQDADGTIPNPNPLTLDSAGRLSTSVYNPTGRWKFIFTHPRYNQTTDDILGALDTSAFGTGSGAVEVPIIAKTGAYTVTADDLGKCIVADPTGGSFAVTLISASVAGDGKTICVRHVGSGNEVVAATVSNQQIKHFDAAAEPRQRWPITERNQGIWFVSDGADWHILANPWDPKQHVFQVADATDTPPVTPSIGAWYIMIGTPTGAWSSYSAGDLVQSTAAGAWYRLAPGEGWQGYVEDENSFAFFNGLVWQFLPTGRAPSGYISGLEIANGAANPLTAIDVATGVARNSDDTLDMELGAALANKLITSTWTAGSNGGLLDQGTVANGTWYHVFLIQNPTTGDVDALACTTFAYSGCAQPSGFTSSRRLSSIKTEAASTNIRQFIMEGDLVLWDTPTLDVDDTSSGSTAKTGTANVPTGFEVLALLNSYATRATGIALYVSSLNSADMAPSATVAPLSTITATAGDASSQTAVMTNGSGQFRYRTNASDTVRIATLGWREPRRSAGTEGPAGAQGAQGDPGPAGQAGLAGLPYLFDSDTTMADPGTGDFRLNNAAPASADKFVISNLTAATGNPDMASYIATWGPGRLTVSRSDAPENIAIYQITSCSAPAAAHRECEITHTSSSGAFPNAAPIAVEWVQSGAKGDQGDPGPTTAVQWAFNTDTTATPTDPGAGRYRFNAAPASATLAWFSNTENGGGDVTAWLDSWDDSGSTGDRGTITIVDPLDSTKFYIYRMTGVVTDRTGYREVNVTYQSGTGTLVNLEMQAVSFASTGPAGSGLTAVVDDPAPTLGGDLRVSTFKIVDEPARPLVGFFKDGAAVNYLEFGNAKTGVGPIISAVGSDAAVDLVISTKSTGALRLQIGGTTEALLGATDFRPGANDGSMLGIAGQAWADLFLASGGVVNFDAGDITITHKPQKLTFAGSTTSDLLVVDDANGRVGINQGTPNATLHIAANDPSFSFEDVAGSPAVTWRIRNSDGKFIYRDNDAGSDRVIFDTNGALGVGPGIAATSGQMHIDQGISTAAIPVLYLDQGDADQEFIHFQGTAGAGTANSISTDVTEANPPAGYVRININGTDRWLRFYADTD